eukprot:CAMPEP_0173419758 /NCGR_PEP_ID=MMETSP1357-20121228/1479_1 /TAXON_ID=77926 /ORGANISM="Hemiselmis rufescens, Strain PCC563" /LENGTH=174 /DNA_ID=CAMNT_0014382445 /DNA_START=32 /DNA_END=552 /DNA_ORIENTATION=+
MSTSNDDELTPQAYERDPRKSIRWWAKEQARRQMNPPGEFMPPKQEECPPHSMSECIGSPGSSSSLAAPSLSGSDLDGEAGAEARPDTAQGGTMSAGREDSVDLEWMSRWLEQMPRHIKANMEAADWENLTTMLTAITNSMRSRGGKRAREEEAQEALAASPGSSQETTQRSVG